MEHSFHANGKLLVTGEYVVLDNALSLALPTQKGQSLTVYHHNNPKDDLLHWESYDERGNCWLKTAFVPFSLAIIGKETAEINTLQHILATAASFNPLFLEALIGRIAQTRLDFPRNWGLGTSSTLITLVAKWANINPYPLLAATFGGSGYDIACATAQSPILYQLQKPTPSSSQLITPIPAISPLDFPHTSSNPINPNNNPIFPHQYADQLYFIYLEKKQNSRSAIAHYNTLDPTIKAATAQQISQLTIEVLNCTSLLYLAQLLQQHEQILSRCLQLPTAQSLYFPDYGGVIKSLGAWGGDFVLATTPEGATPADVKAYFSQKGFHTVIPYKEMVL